MTRYELRAWRPSRRVTKGSEVENVLCQVTMGITYEVSEVRLLLQHTDMSKSDLSIWYDQCMINVGRCLLSTARKSSDLKSTICILNGWSYESCRRRRWPNPCFNARITSKPFGWRKQKKKTPLASASYSLTPNTVHKTRGRSRKCCDLYHQAVSFVLLLKSLFFLQRGLSRIEGYSLSIIPSSHS